MMNKTSNPKFGKVETDNGELWAGSNNEQIDGDDVYNIKRKLNDIGYEPATIKNTIRTNNFEKTLQQFLNQINNTNTGGTTTPVTGGVSDFVSENKWLLLGGVAVLGYFFLSGGLAASDRTVTSVTRYSPRANK